VSGAFARELSSNEWQAGHAPFAPRRATEHRYSMRSQKTAAKHPSVISSAPATAHHARAR
jgi:hypothetical protein